MQSHINNYYSSILTDMQFQIENSEAGSRSWCPSAIKGRKNEYTVKPSTFPKWISFWYEKTPKNLRGFYNSCENNPHDDGYWNGNTKELLDMYNYLLKGKRIRSIRKQKALEVMSLYYFEQKALKESPRAL